MLLRSKQRITTVCCCTFIFFVAAIANVNAAPAKLDAVKTPTFVLEPPQYDDIESVAADANTFDSSIGVGEIKQQQLVTAIDSYGNPIESLKPIDTPDGRKVVSAQGVQFEIPNYASGITEIRKPANELLPPDVGEFDIQQEQQQHLQINALLNNDDNYQNDERTTEANNTSNNSNNNNNVNRYDAALYFNDYNDATDRDDTSDHSFDDVDFGGDKLQHTNVAAQRHANDDDDDDDDNNNNNNNNNNNYNHNNDNIQNIEQTTTAPHLHFHTVQTPQQQTYIQTTLPTFYTAATAKPKLSHIFDSFVIEVTNRNSIPLKRSHNFDKSSHDLTTTFKSSIETPPIIEHQQVTKKVSSSTYVVPTISVHAAPLSSGNFNYPNVPTDISVINRIAAKYHNPLPTIDPIAVAVPNDEDDIQANKVQQQEQQESIHVEVNSALNSKQIPQYLLELNDSDIGGPVEYMPSIEDNVRKFISWDLLPPEEHASTVEHAPNSKFMASTTNYRVSLANNPSFGSLDNTNAIENNQHITPSLPSAIVPSTTQRHRGSVHYTNSTPTPTKTTRKTTPTTRRTTVTTRRTTTTRRPTTTPRTTTTTTTTTTTPAPIPLTTTESTDMEYYKLEKGDSYTLPPWLAGLDYADLDVAVTFIIPTDLNEYNHTIERDVQPPLEPFSDLTVINLPAPKTETTTQPTTTSTRASTTRKTTTVRPSTTTRATTTTTRTTTRATTTARPITSTTARSYWIQTNNSKAPTRNIPSPFNNNNNNNPFTSNHITQTGTIATSSTTRKPNFNFHTSFNTIKNNGQSSSHIITTTAEPFDEAMTANEPQPSLSSNPFLPLRKGNTTPRSTTTTRTTTTTTTTTTTPTPDASVDENPFEPTLPPWLEGFDYPDLGPAVPFIYDPASHDHNVDSDLQAPYRFEEEKPAFLTNSQSQFSSNQISVQQTAASTASSILTAKATSIQTDLTANTLSQPDVNHAMSAVGTSIHNPHTHFPAPFEDDSSVTTQNTPQQSKTTFTKGEGGKVITNSIPTQPTIGHHNNPFLPNRGNSASAAASNNISIFRPTPPQRFAATPTPNSFGRTSTYKSRFGGPPGILTPYDNVRG